MGEQPFQLPVVGEDKVGQFDLTQLRKMQSAEVDFWEIAPFGVGMELQAGSKRRNKSQLR
jgi:hypothetical protein